MLCGDEVQLTGNINNFDLLANRNVDPGLSRPWPEQVN